MTSITINLPDEGATMALGRRVGGAIASGDIICLYGDLGAGKTTLARGLVSAVCGAGEVPSPTYTFVERYESAALTLWHFDLYRLERDSDVWDLGFEDALEDGALIIEWPELIEALLPDDPLRIRLEIAGEHRQAVISPSRAWRTRLNAAGIT